MSLSTSFMGLRLKNPLIVGASPLTCNANGARKCADAGAAAIVLKSLFEEQIRESTAGLSSSLVQQAGMHGEVYEYLEAHVGMRYGTRDYLAALRQCKEAVDIPVIASINCLSDEWWQDFAQEVEAAGANALELNISLVPTTLNAKGTDIENQYANIVAAARAAVSIPISVKLGPNFTSLPEILVRLERNGANGFVLFNRFYRPTIDIDKLQPAIGHRFSADTELSETLRWLSLTADRLSADFAAATGIHDGADMARAILAGAKATQVVTALFKNGVGFARQMLDELGEWMDRKQFNDIEDFRGLLGQRHNPEGESFTRFQYMEALGSKSPKA